MQIDERTVGDVTILDLKGKMTLGEGDELLRDKVNSLIQQGQKKIILNLADVPYIDSAGLGEIVRTYTTVSRQGGSLKLLNLTKRIPDLLAITKLLTVFETFDTEQKPSRASARRRLAFPSRACMARSPLPETVTRDASPPRGVPASILPGQPARLAPAGAVDQEPRRLRGPAVRAQAVRPTGRSLVLALAAFAVFCALSGVVYLVNDVADRESGPAAPAQVAAPDRVGRAVAARRPGRRGRASAAARWRSPSGSARRSARSRWPTWRC